MLKSSVGSCTKKDAFESGKTVAAKAIEGLDHVKMAFVYSVVAYD